MTAPTLDRRGATVWTDPGWRLAYDALAEALADGGPSYTDAPAWRRVGDLAGWLRRPLVDDLCDGRLIPGRAVIADGWLECITVAATAAERAVRYATRTGY